MFNNVLRLTVSLILGRGDIEMKNMIKKTLLLSLFASLIQVAYAAYISGTWKGMANDYPFELTIVQSGNNITGTYVQPAATNVPTTNITGTIVGTNAGSTISFNRSGKGNQVYKGFLSRTNKTISGYFNSTFTPTTYCCVPFSINKL